MRINSAQGVPNQVPGRIHLTRTMIYQSEGFPRTGYLFPARDGLWPGLKKEVLLARRRRRRRRRRHLGIGSFLSQLPT